MFHRISATVCAFAVISAVLFAPAAAPAQSLKKVKFALGSISMVEITFNLAKAKGFYRDEGLDVEMILMRGALGVQALVGNSVDYASSSGSSITAGVRGLGVKLLTIISSTPQYDLVARPEIHSVAQLKGKTVGISSRGGAIDLLTQLILTQHGLTPNKDVVLMVIGSQSELMIALKTGLIAAALITPPQIQMLYRDGMVKLGYAGDYMPTYPNGGIGATEEKIKKDPAEVYAFVKGSLRGLQYYKRNRTEAIDYLQKHLKIADHALASRAYDETVGRLTNNGAEGEPWMKGAIEFTKKSLNMTNEVPTRQVFDFSLVEKAARELK